MDSEFITWLNQSISYEVYASQNGALEKVYQTPVTISCYVEGRKTIIRDARGEEIESLRVFYIDGDDVPSGISIKDRLTYQGVTWPVLGYSEFFDEKGNLYYVEVYI